MHAWASCVQICVFVQVTDVRGAVPVSRNAWMRARRNFRYSFYLFDQGSDARLSRTAQSDWGGRPRGMTLRLSPGFAFGRLCGGERSGNTKHTVFRKGIKYVMGSTRQIKER